MKLFGYNITKAPIQDQTRLFNKVLGSTPTMSASVIQQSDVGKVIVPPEMVDFSLFDGDFMSQIGGSTKGNTQVSNLVSDLRSKTLTRKQRYTEYKKAAKDPIIGQAIEMMADDATQFDVEREKTIWIESEDKEYEAAINGILQDYVEPFIDTVASFIISRGEFVFKVNLDEEGEKRGKYKDVVLVPYKHLEKIHHLILPDQSRYFYECSDISQVRTDNNTEAKNFKNFENFLHFINYSLENSDEIMLSVAREGNKEAKQTEVFILQGESIITDKVLDTYRILSMLEDSLTSYRLSKSKIIRFVNVDVTRLTDNAKSQAIINYVHGAIAANERISKGTNGYEENTINTEPVVITVPVKNGVGQIKLEEFNTTADIANIADVDHQMSKLFAGLRTPRSFFNYDENLPGGGMSGASLVRMDIRYARAVKKTQRVMVNGVKDLIFIFNEINGITAPPKYRVKVVKVASAEDSDRYTEMEQRLSMATQLISGMVDPNTGELSAVMMDTFEKFFTHVVPIQEVLTFIASLKKKSDIKVKPAGLKVGGLMKTNE